MGVYVQTLAKVIDDIKKTNNVEIIDLIGDLAIEIRGISMDSRNVKAGDLYACVPGFNVDGHDFAEEAVKKGAVGLIVERPLPLNVPQVVVKNVRQGLGYFAAQIYGHPTDRLEVIGVTGTNGKTTVTHLVEKICLEAGKKVGIIGTLGARINGRSIPGSRTTPEGITLQELFSQMVDEGVQTVVMEVSSHALDLGRVNGCEFDAGIFTNLTQDHLDYHKTMEEYLRAKALLFARLDGKKQPKIGILNGDDPAHLEIRKVCAAPVATYGLSEHNDYQAYDVENSPEGVKFKINVKGKIYQVEYATPGFFSVYNALAAFAWGIERRLEPELIISALKDIKGVAGRFESVRMGQPFQVIVDYAHTPDGLENVLKTARSFTKGKLITIFGCGGDRDRTKRPLMGKVAKELSDFIIVTSDNPRTEDPLAIIADIEPALQGAEYLTIPDRYEGIEAGIKMAKAGDTVLIAGKGHEDYQIIGTEVRPFDDRVVSRNVLRRLGYAGLDS